MKQTLSTTLLCFCLLNPTLAAIPDSTIYNALHQLANKLHLKPPNPRKGEYEIRVWQKAQLAFGDAHVVYVLKKGTESVQLAKYQIHSNKNGFRRFTRLVPVHTPDTTLWNQLVKQDILTLPDWSIVKIQLQPKQKKDSTRVIIDSDGEVTVKANKIERKFAVSDGETYYFEVFSVNGHCEYSYDNPLSYVKFKPLPELQKVVTILDELSAAFEYRQ